jgi:hypothetical protein
VTSQAASRGGSRARRARAGRITAITLGTLLIAAIATTAWIASRALAAAEHLTTAQTLAGDIQNTLATDPSAATTTATRLTEHTAAARAATDDPLYTAATHLPWIGPQLHALATITTTLDDLTGTGLTPLLDVAANLDVSAFAPQDGVVELTPLVALQAPAATAATAADSAAGALADIDLVGLIGALRAPVVEAADLLEQVSISAGALARATELMPAMLGADGPRNYLVLLQNNAEWRSLGGIAGSVILVQTDAGRITLADAASARDLTDSRGSEPIGVLSDDARGIYGDDPGSYMHNVTQVPDFAISGQLAQAIWEERRGVQVDGVVAIDPVALSYILRAIGPVTLSTGEQLTADNAVQLLLNEVYIRYPEGAVQDAFFAQATEAVFAGLTGGGVDPIPLMEALAQAGNEHRLFIWNADETEQAILSDTTLAGGLPVTDEEATRFGVFVNDGTGSKMDYYAHLDTELGWCEVSTSGDARASLSVTVRSEAPMDAASSLPGYILGGDIAEVPQGITRTFTYVYLPQGSTLVSEAATAGTLGPGTHDGRQVVTWITDLWPGEEATFEVVVQAPWTELLDVVRTPTLNGVEGGDVASVCGGAG